MPSATSALEAATVASDSVQVGSSAAEQRGRDHRQDHDERMKSPLLHQIRLAVSRLNRPSGRNMSTAAMIR